MHYFNIKLLRRLYIACCILLGVLTPIYCWYLLPGFNPMENGFEAALNEACLADQRDARTKTGRSAGSRLTAKLWGMEWLHRYYMMSKKKKFDIFMHVLVDAMKKESATAGPFIKVFGKPGLTAKRY